MTASGSAPSWRCWLIWLLIGGLAFGGGIGFMWGMGGGVPGQRKAGWALLFSLEFALLWLPLLGLPYLTRLGGGLREAAAWLGIFLVGIGYCLIARTGTTAGAAVSLPLGEFIWAAMMLGAVVYALSSLLRLLLAFGVSAKVARFCGGGLIVFLVSAPFWTGVFWQAISVDALVDSTARDLIKHALVWLCPGACLSLPFSGLRFEFMPQMYTLWFGPVVPYPAQPWIFIAGYGGAGGLCRVARWLLGSAATEDVLPVVNL